MAIYRRVGYLVLMLSSHTGKGMSPFQETLARRTSILAGQSGVGKSSLLNVLLLLDHENILINSVLNNSGARAAYYNYCQVISFQPRRHLIDSPGVREFGLWHLELKLIACDFVEFRDYLGTL